MPTTFWEFLRKIINSFIIRCLFQYIPVILNNGIIIAFTNHSGKVMARILIIDDDKLIRWSLKELFARSSNQVDTAATIEEAISCAEKYSYQLICSDIEICGQIQNDFLIKIRKLQPDARMIILSGLNLQQIKQILGDFKVDAVLEKPFNGDKIRKLVDDFLI